MEDENKTTLDEALASIEEMKKTTVSKEKFDKLQEENRTLLHSILNGSKIEEEDEEPEAVDVDALRKELFQKNSGLSNLEIAQKTLDLRKGIMEQGGSDPFLPKGKGITVTADDKMKAENVAAALQECIDKSEGNSAKFTFELSQILQD